MRAPWGFLCVWLFPVAHRRRIPCRPSLACVVLLAIALVERGVFIVVDLSGLWRVDGECGVVSVADAGVLTIVAERVARDGVVPGVFVDSCAGLFFRVLRALGCRVGGDVALVLSCGVCELVRRRLGLTVAGKQVGRVTPTLAGTMASPLMRGCEGWLRWARLCGVRRARSRMVMVWRLRPCGCWRMCARCVMRG